MNNPAILWYPSDFTGSTILWTNEQCGAYIRLLNCQFLIGHLSLEEMNKITTDEVVLSKFIKDEKGKYYNQRLEKEIEKRQNYCNSRSKNKLGKTKEDMKNISKSYDITYDNHMGNRNRNRNINRNINENRNRNINELINDEFEMIWKKYPKKVGKQNAKKDFIKARKEGITFDEIDEGLNDYLKFIELTKREHKYIKDGSTWFHQRNWEDEYTNKDVGISNLIKNSDEWGKSFEEGFIDYE